MKKLTPPRIGKSTAEKYVLSFLHITWLYAGSLLTYCLTKAELTLRQRLFVKSALEYIAASTLLCLALGLLISLAIKRFGKAD